MKNKQYKASLEEEGLNGPVKQVKETIYNPVARSGNYVPGMLSEYGFHNSIRSFSPEGMLTEKLLFTHGLLESRILFNAAGKFESSIHYGKDGAVESTTRRTYNESGEIAQDITDSHARHVSGTWITSWVYDEQGRCIDYGTTLNGALHSRQHYRHDADGNLIEQFIYDKDDALERRLEKAYNAKGEEIEVKEYDRNGALTRHTITHYDGPDGAFSGFTRDGVYTPAGPGNFFDIYQETAHDHHGNWTVRLQYEASGWKEGDRPEHFAFRELTYYGEASENTLLSIENTPRDMAAEQNPIPKAGQQNGLSPAQWQWIAEGATDYHPFNVFRYYTALHGYIPARMSVSSYEIDLWSVKWHLIEFYGAEEVWVESDADGNIHRQLYSEFVLSYPDEGYILHAENIQHIGSHHYSFAGTPWNTKARLHDYVQTGDLYLYYPPARFGQRNEDFEEELTRIISSFRVKKEEEIPQISMVTVMGSAFALKTYNTKDDFAIADLDLNYGTGFENFHNSLMEKFSTTTQGLILFHGAPGTGKTFYVRHLLRKMQESKKMVIYMPPNMVDHLAEPSFMTFISDRVASFRAAGKSCVLLIEDAEPLLVARDENTRIQGITNLLNMTDGLLNDMLGLQIICTFNVALKQLDKALLRPGRLIARKEFKALPEFEANVLAHSLGIKHVFTKPATLGEIFAMAPDKKMLMHDA